MKQEKKEFKEEAEQLNFMINQKETLQTVLAHNSMARKMIDRYGTDWLQGNIIIKN